MRGLCGGRCSRRPMLTYGHYIWQGICHKVRHFREWRFISNEVFYFSSQPLPRPAADTDRAQVSKIEFEQWRNIYSANIHWRMGGISSCPIHITRQKAHRREMSFSALTSRSLFVITMLRTLFLGQLCVQALYWGRKRPRSHDARGHLALVCSEWILFSSIATVTI